VKVDYFMNYPMIMYRSSTGSLMMPSTSIYWLYHPSCRDYMKQLLPGQWSKNEIRETKQLLQRVKWESEARVQDCVWEKPQSVIASAYLLCCRRSGWWLFADVRVRTIQYIYT
jgi:hypothetical protein